MFWNLNANGQSFYKIYNFLDYGFVAQAGDSNLILLFNPHYSLSNSPYQFLKLNFNGDSVGGKLYFDSSVVVKDFKRNLTGGYTSIHHRLSWDYHVRNMDAELDTTFQFVVNDVSCNVGEESIMLSDSTFISKGVIIPPSPQADTGYIFRTDRLGNILWEKQFTNRFIDFSVKDSFVFILSNYTDSLIQTTKINVECLNVFSGIQIWQGELFDSTTNSGIKNSLTAHDIAVNDSGVFLAAHLKTSLTPIYSPYQLIVALDNNGDSLWSEVVNQGRFSNLISNQINELIWIGNNSDSSEIRKFDYQGNLVWRNSLLPGNFDALMSFIETSDGGYAFTSDHRDSVAHFLVAKTDNLGRLNIQNGINQNSFPNINFQFSQHSQECIINLEENKFENLIVNIYSIIGQEVLEDRLRSSETRLNVSGLPSGIYILSIKNLNGLKKTFKFIKLN
jgi:outer membrane protein assembly factor BamB